MPEQMDQLELSVTLGGASFTGGGPADRVMEAMEKFFERVERGSSIGPGDTTAEAAETSTSGPPTQPPEEGGRRQPSDHRVLPVFLREANLRGNPMIATAIVAWAETYEGKRSLTAQEVRTLWRGTSLRAPANINRDMETAVRQGLLHREGRAYSATGHGKQQVGLGQ